MKKEIKKIIFLGTVLLPSFVFAAPTLAQLLVKFGTILNLLPKIFLGLAVVYLMWNIMEYVKAGDPKKAGDAALMITYSIIALFVMISIWGLVAVIQNTTGIRNERVVIPTVTGN